MLKIIIEISGTETLQTAISLIGTLFTMGSFIINYQMLKKMKG